jgi:hypothetical protein
LFDLRVEVLWTEARREPSTILPAILIKAAVYSALTAGKVEAAKASGRETRQWWQPVGHAAGVVTKGLGIGEMVARDNFLGLPMRFLHTTAVTLTPA